MAAHQAPPSLGFSRQEHWSGLPFPSPMHESEKWKWSLSVVSDSSDPMDCGPPGSSVHGIFQARVLEWVAIAFSNCACSYITKNEIHKNKFINMIIKLAYWWKKILLEEINEFQNKWKNIPCSWIEMLHVDKIFSKLIYRFNTILVKILADFPPLPAFFCRNWGADSKIDVEMQGIQNNENNFVKEHISEITSPDLKTLCKAVVIRTVLYWNNESYRSTRIQNWV